MARNDEFIRDRAQSLISGPKAWIGGSAILALVALALAFGVQGMVGVPKVDSLAAGGEVRRLSGDRLKLKDGRDVEFAGIRLPYDDEPYADKAREVLNKWVEDEGVRLRFDENTVDDMGRVHAYIYANDTFINERLVRGGLAFVKLRAGEKKFAEQLLSAQADAQAEGAGLWQSVTPTFEGDLVIEADRGTFHRPDCEKLTEPAAGRETLKGTAAAYDKGLAPCGKCRP